MAVSTQDDKLRSAPEHDPRGEFLGFLLNELGRSLREQTAEALQQLGITLRQLGILSLLEADGPTSQADLGRRLGADRTTIVQMIDRLESLAYVRRDPDPVDRRRHALILTKAGKTALDQGRHLALSAESNATACLDLDEVRTFKAMLQRMHASVYAP